MSRVDIIDGAIRAYCADVDTLPTTAERVAELARFIDGHLAPEVEPDAWLALRMVKAQVDEVLKPRLLSSPAAGLRIRAKI